MPDASCPRCGGSIADGDSSCAGCGWVPTEPMPAGVDQTGAHEVTASSSPQPLATHPGGVIGGYRIVRKLGHGGMGVVWEAEQQHPRRPVALKVIRGGQLVDEHQLKLFQREAQTLARLRHPGIAAIYEAGCTHDGQHFFAMELVHGETLAEHVMRRRGERERRLESKELLLLFLQIADAVGYAHQRAVIHRDLKPSNILVSGGRSFRDGLVAPAMPQIKVVDFGLARITDTDVAATTVLSEAGSVRGTLRYMSPEQARGNPDEIDLRSDVYSLGVILYELLTGGLPYRLPATGVVEAIRIICEERPQSPVKAWLENRHALNTTERRLDQDLVTIILKALEKDPSRRYQSVAGLAGDIDRHLKGYPIVARPPSTAYQLRKLVTRHKVGFGFLALLMVLVIGFSVVMGVLWRRSESARREAELQALRAESQKLIAIGRAELEAYPTGALAYATRSLELVDSFEARLFALQALWSGPTAFVLTPDQGVVRSVAFSPDGRWLGAGDVLSGDVLLYSEHSREPRVFRGQPATGFPVGLVFDSRAERLATWSIGDPEIHVWSVSRESPVGTLDVGNLVWINRDFVVLVGDELIGWSRVSDDEAELTALAWPLAGGPPRRIGMWRSTGSYVVVDRTGTWLAYARGRAVCVRPFDAISSGRELVLGNHDVPVHRLVFAPTGNRIASVDVSNEIRIWTLGRPSPFLDRVLQAPEDPDISFLPTFDSQGQRLVWGSSSNGAAYVWDLEGPVDAEPTACRSNRSKSFRDGAFHPGGAWLATANQSEITLWYMSARHPRVIRARRASNGFHLVFRPTADGLVSCGEGGLGIWSLSGREGENVDVNTPGVWCKGVAIDPTDGSVFWSSSTDRGREVVNSTVEGTKRVVWRPRGGEPRALAFDERGRRLVVASQAAAKPEEQTLEVIDIEAGTSQTFPLIQSEAFANMVDGGVWDLRFSPDGTLYSGGCGGVRRWNLTSGTSDYILSAAISRIDLSGDGRHLLAASGDRAASLPLPRMSELTLIDLATMQHQAITSHGDQLTCIGLDPSGEVIVTGALDGIVRVGPASGAEPHFLLGHAGPVRAVAVSPDGRWVASTAGEEIRLWPMPDLAAPPLQTLPREELVDILHALTNIRVIEDRQTATGWDVAQVPFQGWKAQPPW